MSFFISAGEDYDANIMPVTIATFTFGTLTPMQRSIDILDDLVFEPSEYFNLSLSTSSPDCEIPNPLVPVTILDDGEENFQLLSLSSFKISVLKVTSAVNIKLQCVLS